MASLRALGRSFAWGAWHASIGGGDSHIDCDRPRRHDKHRKPSTAVIPIIRRPTTAPLGLLRLEGTRVLRPCAKYHTGGTRSQLRRDWLVMSIFATLGLCAMHGKQNLAETFTAHWSLERRCGFAMSGYPY
jgi:hypothetical protein